MARRAEPAVGPSSAPAPESSAATSAASLHRRLGNREVHAALSARGSGLRDRFCRSLAGMAAPDESNQLALRHMAEDGEHALDVATRNHGAPLPQAVRERMERAMGHDFNHVRIHTDGAAQQAADALNAHAFALGAELFFGSGEFAPGTHQGDRLLAHELTHVIQHDEGRLHGTGVSSPTDPAEQEAYRNEDVVLRSLTGVDLAMAEAFSAPRSTESDALAAPEWAADAGAEHEAASGEAPSVGVGQAPVLRDGEDDDLPDAKRARGLAQQVEPPAPPTAEEIAVHAAQITEVVAQAAAHLQRYPDFETAAYGPFAERAFREVYQTMDLLDQIDAVSIAERRGTEELIAAIGTVVHQAGLLGGLLHDAVGLGRRELEGMRQDRDEAVHAIRGAYFKLALLYELPAEGGFGAKGRAHAIGGEQDDTRPSPWIGEGLEELDTPEIHVDEAHHERPAPASSQLLTGSVDTFRAKLAQAQAVQQQRDYDRLPNRVDRGKGQNFEMGGNARSFAQLVLGEEAAHATDWEWLHLRASSLSGITGPQNLVLGTRDANTWMIPFESHVKAIASMRVPVTLRVVPDERVPAQDFVGLQDAQAAADLEGNAYRRLDFIWTVEDADHTMRVHPLEWRRQAISKEEIDLVEEYLKAAREALAPAAQPAPRGARKRTRSQRDAPLDEDAA